MLNLIDCVPADLARNASLQELKKTIKSIKNGEERHLSVLEFIYRYRVINLLNHNGSIPELRAFRDHMEWLLNHIREQLFNSFKKPYFSYFEAYAGLIDSRIEWLNNID